MSTPRNKGENIALLSSNALAPFNGGAAEVVRPVPRPAPLRQAVYDALVELIVRGTFPPGTHLVEAELARQLGVSRQPVREALHRLHAEGWIDQRPGQGAFVHTPTEAEVDELLGVRGLLEGESARLAARSATPEGIERLRELCRAGIDALRSGDLERVVAANAALHNFVISLSGNTVLAGLIQHVDRRVRWYYWLVAQVRGKESWDEHQALVEAIAAHDEERAADIMRNHTERTRKAYHNRTER